jgi:diadenylate cyclase
MPANLRDVIELLIFWIGIYMVLRALKGTRGLGVLKGTVTIVTLLYVSSKVLEAALGVSLGRLTFLIEALAPYALVAFVVVFQPEVRRVLTRLGERPFGFLGGRSGQAGVAQQIADACGRMARRRRGALIVIERGIGFRSILESGQAISAEMSGPLLEAIFEPSGPLHDGALVVRGNTIVAASCLLPLSDDPDLDPQHGTRHRAALGLSEETDALVVVVSEETGRMSVAYRGRLRAMRDTKDLLATINSILDGMEPGWATEGAQTAGEREASTDQRRSGVFRASGSDLGRTSSGVERGPDGRSRVLERPAEHRSGVFERPAEPRAGDSGAASEIRERRP